MAELVKTLIRYILDAHNAYNGTGMMMALYFMSLMGILCFCKDEKQRKAILLPSSLMMIFLYIGIPIFNTLVKYLEFFDGRLFWMLITPVITAVGFTLFFCNIEEKKIKAFALVLLIPLCLFCGEFKITNAMYEKAENEYGLSQCAVDLTEYVLKEKGSPKLLVPYTISYPFRQISTDVSLLFGEDATSGRIDNAPPEMREICSQMERVTPDLNLVIPFARERDVDYILFDTVYTELCENGNINIYNYPVDENYVGDRTPSISVNDLIGVSVVDDDKGVYWDLSAYGLKYEERFGQYILYSFE